MLAFKRFSSVTIESPLYVLQLRFIRFINSVCRDRTDIADKHIFMMFVGTSLMFYYNSAYRLSNAFFSWPCSNMFIIGVRSELSMKKQTIKDIALDMYCCTCSYTVHLYNYIIHNISYFKSKHYDIYEYGVPIHIICLCTSRCT